MNCTKERTAGFKKVTASKSIADAGWGKFVNYLEYKCLKYGKKLVKCRQAVLPKPAYAVPMYPST